ncbi:hypothetical protein CLONEX_03459 [[Clostridium] nexile DSM 1787]|nr:hypothetical protein CLONEX_03459 [[Clostridium] nexile DSM 1787]
MANEQEEKVMSETKEFKNGNGERLEKRKSGNNRTGKGNVEGYGYCTSNKQKCLNDCIFGGPALSHIG